MHSTGEGCLTVIGRAEKSHARSPGEIPRGSLHRVQGDGHLSPDALQLAQGRRLQDRRRGAVRGGRGLRRESHLHKLIRDGNPAATIFFLKTKGKNRGYVERQEIAVAEKKPLSWFTAENADVS